MHDNRQSTPHATQNYAPPSPREGSFVVRTCECLLSYPTCPAYKTTPRRAHCTMQDNPANYFVRAINDVDAPMSESAPPTSPVEQTPGHVARQSLSTSWSKLTEQIKGKSRSSTRSSRGPSVDKKDISHPILDHNNPLCPPTPALKESRAVSPSPPLLSHPTAHSSPGASISESVPVAWRHSHSASDPTGRQLPPKELPSVVFTPPTIRLEPSFGSVGTDNSLEDIAESPFEYDRPIESLKFDQLELWLCSMEPARLQPPATGGTKIRAIQQAKDMEELVAERAKRNGDEPPAYDFYELIGKGAYGRVFKGKSRKTGGLVAIKIIDIDKVDYEEMTTKNLSDTIKEIEILQALKDSKARPYVNLLEEARTVHNDLWIISEYASGGSVNTLMKPTMTVKDPGPGLPEKFIIPIARELATALKYVHEAGVIHRDIKSNNVLILEDGSVQLCDFGVSNILEPQKSKRTTIVGTPYWMAPELQREWVKDADPRSLLQPKQIQYGNEVDIWAYGCTVYEMACGFPPHHTTVQWDLPTAGAPQLEGDRFSQELKDFLAFVLQPEAQDRPTPDQMLEHPYLSGSTKLFPTFTLVKLVEEYVSWEGMGGARASLFNPYGAQAPDPLAPEGEDEDNDWSFSTSEEFEFDHAQFGDALAEGQFDGMNVPPEDEDISRFDQLQVRFKEEAIARGGRRLNKVFDTDAIPYRYSAIDMDENPGGRPPSDLALREFNPGAPNRETVIDLDFSMPSVDDIPNIDLGDVPTIRANRMRSLLREMAEEDEMETNDLTAKRETREWKFPAAEDNQTDNRKTMEWSFPSEQTQTNRKTMEWSFAAEQPNRKTMEWSFAAAQPPKPNRRTVEWTFDAAMAENTYEQPPKRTSRRRETKEWTFPKPDDIRSSQEFSFPTRSPSLNGHTTTTSSRPALRHSATTPADDFPRMSSTPSSPLRTSMIDLDMAMVEDYRPSTPGSDLIHTASTSTDNPFNLEDQVHLSRTNPRASFHFQSKSEPNQSVPGMLTPLTQAHGRGVSSASHVKKKQSAGGWSHVTAVYGPGSAETVGTDTSLEEEDVDSLWEVFERGLSPRLGSASSQSQSRNGSASRRNTPGGGGNFLSDTDTDYTSHSDSPPSHPLSHPRSHYRKSRVSAGPNGRPVVIFPIPKALDPVALMGLGGRGDRGGQGDGLSGLGDSIEDFLLKSALELRDGTRAGRDLLRAMRLESVELEGGE